MTKSYVIILCGSAMDIGKNETHKGLCCISQFIRNKRHTKCENYGGPSQVWSSANIMCEQGGGYFQQEIAKESKNFNCAEIVNMSTKR